MDIKHLEADWNSFPEMSMEERPLLSSDLEKMSLHNPYEGPFYLRNKLWMRITIAGLLWLTAIWQIRASWLKEGADLQQQVLCFTLLSYFIYVHVRLLLLANYSHISALSLTAFLSRLEGLMEKYMLSFRVLSILSALYTLAAVEGLLMRCNPGAYIALSGNGFYKWMIILFLSLSFYIVFQHTGIRKYKALMTAIRSYREEIILAKPQKP